MDRYRHARLAALLLAALIPLLGSARPDTLRLSGRVYPAGGGPVGGVRVVARSGGAADTALVDGQGRFELRLAAAGGREVVIEADAADPTQRLYLPSVATVQPDPEGGEHGIVLVPRQWRVRSGTFAGRAVEISLRRAFTPACGSYCSSFFRNPQSTESHVVPSWPTASLPIRVAFERHAASDVSARDSAAFWDIVEQMEAEFGDDLFRPATLEATAPGEDGSPEDVVLVIFDRSLRAVGWGSSVSQQGDIIYGAVRVRDGRVFSSPDAPRLVKHELLHALGVGHTCMWTSAVSDVRVCPGRSTSSLSLEDVAYMQLLQEVRDLQRAVGARQGLEAALAGEHALSR